MTASGGNSYDDPRSLLLTWRNIALNSSRMHYEAQRVFGRRNRWLGYAARTANHRSTAAGYAAVVRLIDEDLAFPQKSPDELRTTADSIRARLDALSQDAPEVPDRVLAQYRKPSLAVSSGTS